MLGKRVLVAIFGIPFIIFCILSKFSNGLFFLLLLLLINFLALNEIYEIFALKNVRIDRPYFIISGEMMLLCLFFQVYYFTKMDYLFNLVFILSISIYFISLIFQNNYKDALFKISFFTFGLFYITYFLSFSLLLKSLPMGRHYLFLIVLLIWANDSFAYFGGRLFGKRKLKIKASPHKTYAGFFSALIFSILAVFLAELIFKDHLSFTLVEKIAVGIIFGIIAILSDLLESVLKRSVSIKDSKSFLPGHGGVLDVFDSWFLVMPLFYFYIKYLH